jgi:hypothetical protein
MLAQGNALGSGIPRFLRPERAQDPPSALSGRTTFPGARPRGVAPGCHPPRRWREIVAMFSSGGETTNRDL